MASDPPKEAEPIDPRNLSRDSEREFYGKHWGNPEFETGVFEIGSENIKAENCTKNKGHEKFIEVSSFSKKHLEEWKDDLLERGSNIDDVFDYIKNWIPFTVKIHVKEISKDRYEKIEIPYYATGLIDAMKSIPVDKPCPCPECKRSPKPKHWSFIVYTASHTILDDTEAASSEFECFYDSEDDKKDGNEVKKLYGIRISRTICNVYTLRTDRCQVLCVTHDQQLADKLNGQTFKSSMLNPLYGTALGAIISHPHGMSKRIGIGKIQHLSVPVGDFSTNEKIPFGRGARYRLPEKWVPGSNQHEIPEGGSELEPGTYALSSQMTYVLPGDDVTEYAFRFRISDFPWLTFPPTTTFFLPNGDKYEFPPETNFSIDMISQPYVYASYDIPTCPGTSGALILMDWGQPPVEGFRHWGNGVDKLNKSGRQLYAQ